MAYFYENPKNNKYGCLTNEYLIIKNTSGNLVDFYKWNGQRYLQISYKNIPKDFIPLAVFFIDMFF